MSPSRSSRSSVGSPSKLATPRVLYWSNKLSKTRRTSSKKSRRDVGKMLRKEIKREYMLKAESVRHAHSDRSPSYKSQPLKIMKLSTRASRRTKRHIYSKPSHSDDSEQNGSLSSSSTVSQDTMGNIPPPTPITPRLPSGNSGTSASSGNVVSSAAVPLMSSLDQQQAPALQNGAIFSSMSATSEDITSSELPSGIPQIPMEVLQFLRIWCRNYEQAVRSQTSTSDEVMNTTSASLGFNLKCPSLNHPLPAPIQSAAPVTSTDTFKTPGDSNIIQMDEAPDISEIIDGWFKPSPEELEALMTELGIPMPLSNDDYLSSFFNDLENDSFL